MNAIDKEILRLAVPSIIANVTVPLLGLVDLSLSGHLESAVYIGAIAVASMMFNLIYWNFTFLRMGTTGMTAQYYGSGDRYMQSLTLYRSVGISLAIGVVLLALQDVLCSIALAVLKPGEEVAAAAVSYYRICIYGAPAVMVGMSLKGWFLGMQNSRYPMAVSIIENLLNVCVSVIAVYVLGIGFKGIAVGTVVAVYTSCGLSAVLLVRRYGRELMPMSIAKILRSGGISRFFQVNADIFMRSVFLLVVTLAFTSIGARAGNEVLAVKATLMQLFLFYSYFTDGFAFAGEAVSGKYAGRGDASMFGRSTRRLMPWHRADSMVAERLRAHPSRGCRQPAVVYGVPSCRSGCFHVRRHIRWADGIAADAAVDTGRCADVFRHLLHRRRRILQHSAVDCLQCLPADARRGARCPVS